MLSEITLRLRHTELVGLHYVRVFMEHPAWTIHENADIQNMLAKWCEAHHMEHCLFLDKVVFDHKSDALAFVLRWQGAVVAGDYLYPG